MCAHKDMKCMRPNEDALHKGPQGLTLNKRKGVHLFQPRPLQDRIPCCQLDLLGVIPEDLKVAQANT